MKFARARQFTKAVAAHDLEAAEEFLDPDVETVTPRGTLRGIAACRQVLQKASGEIEGDVIAPTQEVRKLSDLVGCDRR